MKKKGLTVIEIIVAAVIVIILLLILGGALLNEKNKISEGTVVEREYESGYMTDNGYVHPKCKLTIEGEKNGKLVQYTFEVPESEYAQYQVGDHYPKPRE